VTSSETFPASIQGTGTFHYYGNGDGTQCCHANVNGLDTHLYHTYVKKQMKLVYITYYRRNWFSQGILSANVM